MSSLVIVRPRHDINAELEAAFVKAAKAHPQVDQCVIIKRADMGWLLTRYDYWTRVLLVCGIVIIFASWSLSLFDTALMRAWWFSLNMVGFTMSHVTYTVVWRRKTILMSTDDTIAAIRIDLSDRVYKNVIIVFTQEASDFTEDVVSREFPGLFRVADGHYVRAD